MPPLTKKVLKPFWQTSDKDTVKLYLGDVLNVLRQLPSNHVQTVITSPPYWSLRDYGTAEWEGGDENCDHKQSNQNDRKFRSGNSFYTGEGNKVTTCSSWTSRDSTVKSGECCRKCGAKRIDQQIGLENSVDDYVAKIVEVFREVRRVLRDDGTCWLNLGDSYSGGGGYSPDSPSNQNGSIQAGGNRKGERNISGRIRSLPSGNLVGVPWRVALALQTDGWILRQDIIWCLSGGTCVYVRSQKGDMPMMVRDLARLDPTTVKLWNGEKWTQLLGMNCSSRDGEEIELVLRSGERISCTPTHKFPSSRGLLAASELVVGDCLQSCRLPEPDEPLIPKHVGLDAAWFAGLYLAEGSWNGDNKISISGHRKEFDRWNRVSRIVKSYGGYCTLTMNGNNQTIRVYGKVICAVVRELITGKDAKTKGINPVVWRYGDEFLRSLMLGYLGGDGHVDPNNNRWRLGFARNYNLERDFRTACARLGWTLTLNPSFADCDGRKFPTFRGEIRIERSGHWNEKDRAEIVEIRKARCREVYDLGVADEPHTFALASGILTHNSKPSPMPESVRNRCTKAHEYIFLLAKRSGYFYDAEAIKESSERELSEDEYAEALGKYPGRSNDMKDLGGGKGKGFKSATPPGGRNKRSVWTVDDDWSIVSWLLDNYPDALAEYLGQENRCTSTHEYVFLLAKQKGYFYDADSIKEDSIDPESLAGRKPRDKEGDKFVKSEGGIKGFAATRGFSKLEEGKTYNQKNKRSVWSIASFGYPGAHFACVDADTEALTKSGWKGYADLKDGDLIAAYSQNRDRLEWQEASIHCYEYDGLMVSFDKRDTSQLLTPNHRCLVKSRKGKVKIRRADSIKMAEKFLLTAEFDEQPELSIGEDMATLVGWYASEGHKKSDSRTDIYQSNTANPANVNEIRQLLYRLRAAFEISYREGRYKGEPREEVVFRIRGTIAQKLIKLCPNKEVTDRLTRLPRNELEALLAAFTAGDGHTRLDDGRRSIIQKGKKHIDRLQVIAMKLGYRGHVSQKDEGCYVLYLTRGRWLDTRGTNGTWNGIQYEDYRGVVWCPHVESGLWLARRNGKTFITGNTFPPALVEPCLLAGTSEYGCCGECGAPWRRVVEQKQLKRERPNEYVKRVPVPGVYRLKPGHKVQNTPGKQPQRGGNLNTCSNTVAGVETKTVGWEPTCTCNGKFVKRLVTVSVPKTVAPANDHITEAEDKGYDGHRTRVGLTRLHGKKEGTEEVQETIVEYVPSIPLEDHPVVPCVVLDPFVGSGTVCCVAIDKGRRSIGIDLSEQYLTKNCIPRIEGELLSRPALAALAGRKTEKIDLGEDLLDD